MNKITIPYLEICFGCNVVYKIKYPTHSRDEKLCLECRYLDFLDYVSAVAPRNCGQISYDSKEDIKLKRGYI